GLSVGTFGLTMVTLTWGPVSGATSYRLYRALSGTGSFVQVYNEESNGYVDIGVTYATAYDYRVTAVNSAGESEPSPIVSCTTETPSGFEVTGSTDAVVDYTFNYLNDFNSHPRYESVPVGLWIVVPSSGPQAGKWTFNDHIEGINLFYHPEASLSDYPPATGWRAVLGDTETSILLTPF
ncbi:MAG TPA: fibronectin type III domain-containing protein, partial [Candidatus Krumholzibacterium sp.]|nr:fibronectin type III domain-containing protein [Candidatus Krumholzibacterium sp.]